MPAGHLSLRLLRTAATVAPIVGALAFVVSQCLGREQWIDLHCDDEALYLQLGRDMMTSGELPDAAYAPIYCLITWIVSLVTPASAVPADLTYWLLIVVGAATLLWALKPVPQTLAALLTAWWVTLPFVSQATVPGAQAMPNVYLLGQCYTFVVLGTLARERYRAALLLLALAPFARAEVITWLVGIPLLVLVLGVRARLGRTLPWFVAVAAAWIVGLLLLPSLRERSWLAFQQHYARHAVVPRLQQKYGIREGDVPPPEVALAAWLEMQDAFTHPEQLVAADFPGANTLPGALLACPGHFLSFVGTNLAQTPRALEQTIQPHDVPLWTWRALLGTVALAAGCGWWRRRRVAPGRPTHPVAAAYLALPTCILPMSWVGPRVELLAPLFPLVAATLGVGLGWLMPRRWWDATSTRLAIGAALLGTALLLPGPFHAKPTQLPSYREGLSLVRSVELPANARVLCDRDRFYATYVTDDDVQWVSVELLSPEQRRPERLLASDRVDHVLLGLGLASTAPELAIALRSGQDPQWQLVAERDGTTLWRRR